nr:MAG TPA: hypothetical protein [Caudoviricetes sp.]
MHIYKTKSVEFVLEIIDYYKSRNDSGNFKKLKI